MSELTRYAVKDEKDIWAYFRYPNGEWVKFSDAEAALKAKDARIKELEEALKHYTDLRPFACSAGCWCAHPYTGMIARKALEPSPLTPEELAEYAQECIEETIDE